ncbi:MAG: acetate uptake transporter [Candidatus Methanoplasma sp.]|jgi:succinate-acetate transporter protein|nr:acetate uptake transporter [Candidatus Methanoplasma sp.]
MTSNETANPATLGLFGFGMTVILLSIHNMGFFGMDPTILAAAIFLGGIAQVIAGMIEFKRNKMFTATVFTFFGLFWITFATVEIGILGSAEHNALATMFLVFLILTSILFLGPFRSPRSFQLAFLMIVVLLIILTYGAFTGSEIAMQIGGAFGVVTGALAIYIASAEILNEQYQRPVLPL